MLTLGVIADTHIPDRMRALPAELLEKLAGVNAILHAGDVSIPSVLKTLEQIAPVYAVAGNRDLLMRHLPKDLVLTFENVRLGLTHGHGGWRGYLSEKVLAYRDGYQLARYQQRVRTRFGAVQVIVFGHSHRAVNERREGVLFFNPGSVGPNYEPPNRCATFGLLRIDQNQVMGEIVKL